MTTWIPEKPSHEHVSASVRWFDAASGYGFLALSDGQPDVFCHISVVRGAGFETLPEGAAVICDIVRHPKNAAVTHIHAVNAGTSPCVPSQKDAPATQEAPGNEERRSERRLAAWTKRLRQ
ncbi:MAG: cold shock domain-containing protein [Alphaproteobacteria bacterium]|nr:cold shock domain-containing protein [Alphaproteobacteria bacterium]